MAATEAEGVAAILTGAGARFEVRTEPVRGNLIPVFKNRLHSLREIVEASRRFDDRIFVIEEEQRISYAGHLAHVDAFAVALQGEFSIRPGDRVGIYAANRWEWIVSFWAVASIGAIPCGMNGWWTPEEFAHAVALVEPALVIGDAPRLARLNG